MHEYRSPALKRLNCLLSEMDAAYHEAAQRQGQNDSSRRTAFYIWSRPARGASASA